MEKVSIIIPTYNAELHIIDCLNSIVNQSYSNLELIIVNDGSTDSTTEKIEKFIENHTSPIKIEYFIKENAGVSSARNKGIELATGKFIIFIDSDDTVSPEHVSSLIAPFNELDPSILVCNRLVDEHRRVKNISVEGFYDLGKFEQGYSVLENSNQLGYLHNKIFSKDIIVKNNILFNEEISMAEDLLFVLKYIGFISGFYFSTISSYHYKRSEGSLSETKLSDKQILCYLDVLSYSYNELKINIKSIKGMGNSIDFYYGLKKTTSLMSVYIYRTVKNIKNTSKIKKEINGSLSFNQIITLKRINAMKYLIMALPHGIAQRLIKKLYRNKY